MNYAETFLFVWGLVILGMKFFKAKRQSQAMLLDILPKSLGLEITSGNVGSYIEHIYKLPFRLRDSLMVNRIRKALELFEKRNNNGEVVNVLNAQSDIDMQVVDGRFHRICNLVSSYPNRVLIFRIDAAGFGTYLKAREIADSYRIPCGWEMDSNPYHSEKLPFEVNRLDPLPPADPNAPPQPPKPSRQLD